MKIKIFQKGFNYSQDGTGNRLVYHLQGCNMHCPWCANPESMSRDGTLMVYREWLVDTICPFGAIHGNDLKRSVCKKCSGKECVRTHKNKGIRCSYEEYEIDAILEEVKRSSMLFFNGGGITLTGGEPTLQFEGVKRLLHRLKENGIHTAIETNGTHRELESLFPLIDLLIMDFKHYNSQAHARATGIGNNVTMLNIAKALEKHKNVLIRIPLIKSFNASENDAEGFVDCLKEYNTQHASFEFLPYHEYGKAKWLQCGMKYEMENAFVNQEIVALYERKFKENNLSVIHT